MYEAVAVLLVILRMLSHPFGISSRMVGHPVEPHLHIQRMGRIHQRLQVSDGAVVGVGLLEICGGVWAVDASTPWIDRHQPDNVHTECLQFAESLLGGGECSFCGERADVHLVNHLMACFILGRG